MPLGLISGAEITQCNVPGGSQQLFSDDNRIASDEWVPELGRWPITDSGAAQEQSCKVNQVAPRKCIWKISLGCQKK